MVVTIELLGKNQKQPEKKENYLVSKSVNVLEELTWQKQKLKFAVTITDGWGVIESC